MAGLIASDPNADMTNPQPIALNACDDPNAQKLEVTPNQKIRLTPIEPDGVRESYVAPTIDGGEEMFTESITYQWVIGDGSRGDTPLVEAAPAGAVVDVEGRHRPSAQG